MLLLLLLRVVVLLLLSLLLHLDRLHDLHRTRRLLLLLRVHRRRRGRHVRGVGDHRVHQLLVVPPHFRLLLLLLVLGERESGRCAFQSFMDNFKQQSFYTATMSTGLWEVKVCMGAEPEY